MQKYCFQNDKVKGFEELVLQPLMKYMPNNSNSRKASKQWLCGMCSIDSPIDHAMKTALSYTYSTFISIISTLWNVISKRLWIQPFSTAFICQQLWQLLSLIVPIPHRVDIHILLLMACAYYCIWIPVTVEGRSISFLWCTNHFLLM